MVQINNAKVNKNFTTLAETKRNILNLVTNIHSKLFIIRSAPKN